ncbi:transcriptional regulator protein (plasmid) [Rhizobium phaseoli]|nr:transcriptional regulator protein [Rhizobium phaseoli]
MAGSNDHRRRLETLALQARTSYILNQMVQYVSPPLNLSFAALSDATRRGIIDQLGRGEASITSLADTFQMTLTGMKKHVQVLERAGLVVTQKVGRVRTCKLGKRGLKAEAEWIEAHRKLFEARFEALDEIISEMKQEGRDD